MFTARVQEMLSGNNKSDHPTVIGTWLDEYIECDTLTRALAI
jgi:hypothetical protein